MLYLTCKMECTQYHDEGLRQLGDLRLLRQLVKVGVGKTVPVTPAHLEKKYVLPTPAHCKTKNVLLTPAHSEKDNVLVIPRWNAYFNIEVH
jgi:hypothetical protein